MASNKVYEYFGSENWKKSLRQASFRGVPFFVDSSDSTYGRDYVQHKYPNRDGVKHEDMGMRERVFSFNAYIFGEFYHIHREELIKKLEMPGSGKLVHPYRGDFTVVVVSSSLSESVQEGGVCRFSVSFAEDMEEMFTFSSDSPTIQLKTSSEKARKETLTWFEKVYKIGSSKLSYFDQAIKTLEEVANDVKEAKKSISFVSEYWARINSAIGKLYEIVFLAIDLAEYIRDIFSYDAHIGTKEFPSIGNGNTGYREYRSFLGDDFTLEENTDSNPAIDIKIAAALNATISLGAMFASMNFKSVEDAEEKKLHFMSVVDYLVSAIPSMTDELYESLYEMKKSVDAVVLEKLPSLGRLYEYSVNEESLPAIVIAKAAYNNLDKELEILDMNNVINPFFVSAPAKVISNA